MHEINDFHDELIGQELKHLREEELREMLAMAVREELFEQAEIIKKELELRQFIDK